MLIRMFDERLVAQTGDGRTGASTPALLSSLVAAAVRNLGDGLGAGNDPGDGHTGRQKRKPGEADPENIPGACVGQRPGSQSGCHG